MKVDTTYAIAHANELVERAKTLGDLAGNIGPALAEIARLADVFASLPGDADMDAILDPIMGDAAYRLRMLASAFDGGAGEEAIYFRIIAEMARTALARAEPDTEEAAE